MDVGANDRSADTTNLPDLLSTEPLSNAQQAYLTHLTSLPLDNLVTEPSSLQTQAHHLTSSLTSLTHTSYPTFLALHQTTKSLSSSLDIFADALDGLLDSSLPALEEAAAGWHTRTDTVVRERNKARAVLEQHDKLRDLLDIPLLIDTCVRNGFFAEALQLAAHAEAAAAALPHPPPILRSVLAEVHASIVQMLRALLGTLHEPARKLPALYKAVAFLRRMPAFAPEALDVDPEEQLALAFLGGRHTCVRAALEPVARDVRRLASSQAPLGEREREDLTRGHLPPHIRRPTPASDPPPVLHALLSAYASNALTAHLLPVLRAALPQVPLSALPPVLTQLTYCATAFARSGLDFRTAVAGLAAEAVRGAVAGDFARAARTFAGECTRARASLAPPSRSSLDGRRSLDARGSLDVRGSLDLQRQQPSTWLAPPNAPNPRPEDVLAGPSHVPPAALAAYPPLATLANGLLTALNGLRLLAPVEVLPALRVALDAALAEAGGALLGYVSAAAVKEKDAGMRGGEMFFDVLVSFVRRALVEGVYGEKVGEDEKEGELAGVVRDWEAWRAASVVSSPVE
ncbi:Dor1-like family-domain-containing protein [Schizophyllum amplum]|uniref:Conserved oligomeric Golgi complex subunit 8 n=1 Tax=Schizophyllum amplum TaxID=97359 RepID=A0A550D065_9AGAR|nr:Dor1-like family-domain-containing protein [Auriculariopsis ampla]